MIEINKNGKVDARQLHKVLGSKQQFADWIKKKVVNNPFLTNNQDFNLIHNITKQKGSGGHNKIDYELSIDAAKKSFII